MVEILSEVSRLLSGMSEFANRKDKRRGKRKNIKEETFLIWEMKIMIRKTTIENKKDSKAALELIKNKESGGKKEQKEKKILRTNLDW